MLFYYKTSLREHFLKKFFDEQPVYDTSGTNITGKLKKIIEKTVQNMVRVIWMFLDIITQIMFTCSKSTIETLERGVKICSKLTIKAPERLHWRLPDVYIVNFEHISYPFFSVSIVDFEQVNASCVIYLYWLI